MSTKKVRGLICVQELGSFCWGGAGRCPLGPYGFPQSSGRPREWEDVTQFGLIIVLHTLVSSPAVTKQNLSPRFLNSLLLRSVN